MVGFTPANGGMKATGAIQSDGSYTLKTNRSAGLETGEYVVTIVSREQGERRGEGGPPMPGPFITPERYAQENSSDLRYEVQRGSNRIDIELTSEAP